MSDSLRKRGLPPLALLSSSARCTDEHLASQPRGVRFEPQSGFRLRWLERAFVILLSPQRQISIRLLLHLHLKTEADAVSETSCIFITPDDGEPQKHSSPTRYYRIPMLLCDECYRRGVERRIVCTPSSVRVFVTLTTQQHLEYRFETLCISSGSHTEP
jgi:hypothetical protein